jgi:hypothetical protein
MSKIEPKSNGKPDRLKPLSLHPLTPEQALSGFMRVDPKKIEATKRESKKKKPEK